jgi:integrase
MLAQALLLLRKTGMRIGELRDLELECLEHISDENYLLHVPLGKLHTERVLPVDSETVSIIKQITELRPLSLLNPKNYKGRQYLITNRFCRRPSYAGLRGSLGRMAIQSGIHEPVSPHMLRHTYATELLRNDMNLAVLKELMGHKDISMTLRYTKIVQPDIRKAYHAALENSSSLYGILMPQKTDINSAADGSIGSVLGGIANAITKIESLHKDTADKTEKKKAQRMVERLRRIYNDLEQMPKVN